MPVDHLQGTSFTVLTSNPQLPLEVTASEVKLVSQFANWSKYRHRSCVAAPRLPSHHSRIASDICSYHSEFDLLTFLPIYLAMARSKACHCRRTQVTTTPALYASKSHTKSKTSGIGLGLTRPNRSQWLPLASSAPYTGRRFAYSSAVA